MDSETSEISRLRLDFDTPQFLHELFANDPSEIAYMEETCGIRVVTRGNWVLLEGPKESVQSAKRAFDDLEQARRNDMPISQRDFRQAVDSAAGGEKGLADFSKVKILAVKGRPGVTARTPQQLNYVNEIEQSDVTFGLGPAGTGKTYLAMAMALSGLKKGLFHRIILTRPAVEAGEALGFLPGDLNDKVAPYLRPLHDALHDMLAPEEAQKLMENGTIEIAPLAYMRGRTLSRAFVILDEGQNTTREQMMMFLTRLGEGSRCVVTGDASQVDLKRGIGSGLVEAERVLADVEGVGFVRFSSGDVVRHPVVARIIDAYDAASAN